MSNEKMKPWGFELEEYSREGEPDKAACADAWQIAVGLQAVDGLKPSRYLAETAQKNIDGGITIGEAESASKAIGRKEAGGPKPSSKLRKQILSLPI